jgi:hypothetical protein
MVNLHLQRAILEVVENRLRANDPPETRRTFDRLLAVGHSREDAIKLIGQAVVREIWEVMTHRKPYDAKRYIKALEKLR